MIFSPITTDLVLSLSLYLAKLPEFKGTEPSKLFDLSIEILDRWGKEIASRKLSISLDAITSNVLCYANPSADEDVDVLLRGNNLIRTAEAIEGRVLAKQATELAKQSLSKTTQPFESRLTAALRQHGETSFSKAAQAITHLANATDAGLRLKEYLLWMRDGFAAGADLQSELESIIEQKRKLSPSAIQLLESYYPFFRTIEKDKPSKSRTRLRKGTQK